MQEKKIILIVDDNILNRKILGRILSEEYEVIQAENGKQALELLETKKETALILLDIQMPVMNGFEFLKEFYRKQENTCIPVIVSTGITDQESERKALELGAWDFINKPYNPETLKFRMRNAIERSRITAIDQAKYQMEYDLLTGIYNKDKFIADTRAMLNADKTKHYVMVRFDIDRFHLINSLYGQQEGNAILCYISELLRKLEESFEDYTYGRVEADIFTFCASYQSKDEVMHILKYMQNEIKARQKSFNIVAIFGVYYLENPEQPVDIMIDMAAMAAKTRKGQYTQTIAVYTADMRKKLEVEQNIINVMSGALNDKEFQVYYQAKYNLKRHAFDGAEALVRWKRGKDMIPPNTFIPIFEKNGFVAKLDYYVWERVCQDLRRWLDSGIYPHPVSVNMSRINLYNPQIVKYVCNLLKKYDIPVELFQIELTESAYMDNQIVMKNVVKEFQKYGFTILMDDFGSGYSSLNTLKDISVDILKLDMKFLPNAEKDYKSECIIASVIHMASWLGISVVAEGVEKKEQMEFLESVGCDCIQGYYYARPVPVEEYERLFREKDTAPENRKYEKENLEMIWSSRKEINTLLKAIAVPVGIYECNESGVLNLRFNQTFLNTFDKDDPVGMLTEEEVQQLQEAFERAEKNKGVEACDCCSMAGGRKNWWRLKLQFVQRNRLSSIFCIVFIDITREKELEENIKMLQ